MPFVKSITVECGTEIYLWSVTEDAEELQIICDECGVEYSEEELDMPEHRLIEILAARLLLYNIYGEYIRILHHESGAPYIVGEDYISISHTKGAVAVAVSENGLIGIDIEGISARVLRIKDKFLNETERGFIAGDDIKHTMVAWCAKEALFKAIPEGGIDFRENLLLDNFQLTDSDTPTTFNAKFIKDDTDDAYRLYCYKYENYLILFAALSND